ncbi:MAG: hypothetical protein ABL907_23375 [Hyphomicrobium sp.]
MSILKSLINTSAPAGHENLDDSPDGRFDAAIAAMDRAAAERVAAAVDFDQRTAFVERRKGAIDTRPEGSPDRRNGLNRRSASSQSFGKRNAGT